jgi:Fur family ferric uptake transcriptional regulator
MAARTSEHEEVHAQLAAHLVRNGLKHTRQREALLESFLQSKGHVTVEELHEAVRDAHPEIGAATVYRTLKLFCEAGIASAHHFREGITLYEHEVSHHDHLICVGCGEIIEFSSELIEQEQVRIAREYGYKLTQHRHHLLGYCPPCQEQGIDTP